MRGWIGIPSNPSRPTSRVPAPPTKPNATYTDEDGSKYMTVQKSSTDAANATAATRAINPHAALADMAAATKASSSAAANATGSGGVNRKKQKRREKQAARQAAEGHGTAHGEHVAVDPYLRNGHANASLDPYRLSANPSAVHNHLSYVDQDFDDDDGVDGDDLYYSDEDGQLYQGPYDPGNLPANGHALPNFLTGGTTGKKSKKKKKAKNAAAPAAVSNGTSIASTAAQTRPPPPPPPPLLNNAPARPAHAISRDRIWNTSTQEERERIKEFWLSLSEEDRRSLVKVEKEAVLRKMKEQQKHSCSCTVCGRKRTAIEEELEVLYDAYYEELEQYANQRQTRIDDGMTPVPPPRQYRLHPGMPPRVASKARLNGAAADEDDELEEEDYSDEEDDEEDYSDDDPDDEARGPAADFFNFGNNLTVQGGILTVADDLLKNDGKKFIEMMEQLAERRMQREEEAQYVASGLAHPSLNMHGHAGHNHPPQLDEDEYDEEEEDAYDSQEDDDYDDEEMDMTEEQRMEEGRRMFQIFAARMFEQRVLTAYREKVAQERQRKLLEELEEETRLDVEREQKKAKEAQKKKDKKRLQKQAKDEEKARKDAEKAAEEAAARAVEEKKAEEIRSKKEEQRKRREAEKKAQEDERARKEAERTKRLQEERERQAEAERKQREQKELGKKKREEARKKERDEREARERETRQKKEREERERKDRAAKARHDREAKDRAKKGEQAAQQAAAQAATVAAQAQAHAQAQVQAQAQAQAHAHAHAHAHAPAHAHAHAQSHPPSQPAATLPKRSGPAPPMSAPPGLPTPAFAPTTPSPHLQITTPAIPKAPAPIRPRQASQQGSVGSSPRTPHVAAGAGQTLSPGSAALPQQSPGPVGPPGKATGHPTSTILAPVAPAAIVSPPGMPLPSTTGFPGLPSLAHSHLPSSQAPMAPPLTQRASVSHDMSTYAHAPPTSGPSSRAFSSPTAAPFHPSTVSMAHAGSSAVRTAPPARGIYADETSPLSQPTAAGPMGSSVGMASFNAPRATMPTHSRQQSASFDPTTFDVAGPVSQTQPIARPTPIQRPRPDELHWPSQSDMDDLSSHLGSSALLDDTDDAFPADAAAHRRGSAAPGLPGPPTTRSRFSFGPSMFTPSIGRTSDLDRAPGRANVGIEGKMDGATLGNPPAAGDNWGTPHLPFGAPGLPSTTTWTNNPGSFFGPAAPRRPQLATEDGAAWASTSSYGIIGGPHRPTLSRPVTVRLLICQACKQLAGLKKPGDVFHEVSTLLHQVDQIRPAGEGQVTPQELLDICETEGDAHNGGGYFTVKHDGPGKTYVKHEQDGNTPGSTRGSLAPGEIGSPLSGTIPPFGGARPFQPASGVTSPSSGS